jgi:Ca2+-binding RTX toxin-like protein
MAIVYGTTSSETINASDGVTDLADTIYGYGGNDTIFGLGGNDLIIGGLGADIINGGNGIDAALYTDSATGVTVNLSTGKGSGGTAQGDTLTSIENLYGSAFDDALTGNSANNNLSGMAGDDVLKGAGGDDVLSGGDDDDLLLGGTGADTLYGGSGSDTASYAGSTTGVHVFLHGQYENFGGDAEGDTLIGIENLTGSSHNDRLDGDNHANVLIGLDGNDVIDGRGGADTMIGGKGDDDYYVQNPDDVIVENVGEGKDIVGTTVSYALGAGVEVETLVVNGESTTTNINLTGNEFSQYIGGNAGDNIIDGRGGGDTMEGREGNDSYYVDSLADVVIELADQGNDTVYSTLANYVLSDLASVEILSLDTATDTGVNITGNAQHNTIFGNGNDNVLNGGGANDILSGLGGNDTFVFQAGQAHGDVVYEFAGNGAGLGDQLQFVGYGPGATFAQATATEWIIASADGSISEVITFIDGPAIDPSDYVFL